MYMNFITTKSAKYIYKNLFVSGALIMLFSLISCGSVPKAEEINLPEPEWIVSKDSCFPKSEFISNQGTGLSALESKNNAISNLASYFNTNVKSIIQGDTVLQNDAENETKVERTLKSSILTTTDLDLFALETTEPYFLKRENKWYCVAYINRQTAWLQYEPVMRNQRDRFYGVYDLAQNETEPLNKIKTLKQAEGMFEDFMSCFYKASVFSKELTEKKYGRDLSPGSSIPAQIQQQKNLCTMYLPADGISSDYSAELNKIFSNIGFTVTDDRVNSLYNIEASVDYHMTHDDEMMILNPSVRISVKSKNKTLYSYDAVIDRILSYNEVKGRKTADSELIKKIDDELADDFVNKMGLSK